MITPVVQEIVVHHEPIGQPRHRVSTTGGFAKMYLPCRHPVHGFKRAIQAAFGRKSPIHNGVEIVVTAWFPRPKSKTWKTRPMPPYRHTRKPDADNVLKAVLDALNKLAWVDDAQIATATISKWVCGEGMLPRVHIQIVDLGE